MIRHRCIQFAFALLPAVSMLGASGLAQSLAPPTSPLALERLAWRHIGPASYGGRIDDIEAASPMIHPSSSSPPPRAASSRP